MIERYAAWGMHFSDYSIFFNNYKKKPSMHAGLTQKASRAFPDFCTMGQQIGVQSTDNQATAS